MWRRQIERAETLARENARLRARMMFLEGLLNAKNKQS
jgi:hypothetical protein